MIEFALPEHLSPAQQRSLVLEYAASLSDLSAENLTAHAAVPMTMAIHEGKGRNPHIHMLVSSSIHDGIERVPGLWFARYNSKQPERGGAKRSRAMTKKSWLVRARELWAIAANRALRLPALRRTWTTAHTRRGEFRQSLRCTWDLQRRTCCGRVSLRPGCSGIGRCRSETRMQFWMNRS